MIQLQMMNDKQNRATNKSRLLTAVGTIDFDEILRHRPDPLGILTSTKPIVENPQHVFINTQALERFVPVIQERINQGLLLDATQFGVQQVGIEKVWALEMCNFYFWAKKGELRWEQELSNGSRVGGWRALVASFDRALRAGVPLLDPHYLSSSAFTLEKAREIFAGVGGVLIPLLAKRHEHLATSAEILIKKYDGSVQTFLERASFDAINIARQLVRDFPSYKDIVQMPDGQKVIILKRAQIMGYDLSMVPGVQIGSTHLLTLFADYRVPQIYHEPDIGILQYSEDLQERIQRMELIISGSREELELRASSIWVGEFLAQRLGVSQVIIDNATWLMASTRGDQGMKFPHHRTETTAY